MKKSTETLLTATLILVVIYVGWQFAAQTVVTILRQQSEIAQLKQQLKGNGN